MTDYLDNNFAKHAKFIKAFKKITNDDIWQSTEFLKIMQQNLVAILADFQVKINYDNYLKKTILPSRHGSKQLRKKQLKLYIALFNTQCEDFQKWYLIIKAVINAKVNWPIYQNKEDLLSLYATKDNTYNHGYLEIYLDESSVNTNAVPKQDKLGAALTSIIDGSIRSEDVVQFVHENNIYVINKNQLILQDS